MARATALLILLEAILGVMPFLLYGYAAVVSGMGGPGLMFALLALLLLWVYVNAARMIWRGWSSRGEPRGLSIAVVMGAVVFGIGLFFSVVFAGCASIINCGSGDGGAESVIGGFAFVLFLLLDVYAACLLWNLPSKPAVE